MRIGWLDELEQRGRVVTDDFCAAYSLNDELLDNVLQYLRRLDHLDEDDADPAGEEESLVRIENQGIGAIQARQPA